MLQYILGVVVVAVGGYLISEEKSGYESAKSDYDTLYANAQQTINSAYELAKMKSDLDNLHHFKRIKKSLLSQIKGELASAKGEYAKINCELKFKKERLDTLFAQKRQNGSSKKVLQGEIDTVLATRKELFAVQSMLKANLTNLHQTQNTLYGELQQIHELINTRRVG